jgi:cell wall assembly regulator SMI1
MREAFGQADEEQIQSFERLVGHRLPDGYRRFLLQHNGGQPLNDEFEVPAWGVTGVQYFFGLQVDDGYDLRWNQEVVADRLPVGVIPIATDSGGNAVCLGISGEQFDRVLFWDHEDEAVCLVPLAATFEDFVNHLAPDGTYS